MVGSSTVGACAPCEAFSHCPIRTVWGMQGVVSGGEHCLCQPTGYYAYCISLQRRAAQYCSFWRTTFTVGCEICHIWYRVRQLFCWEAG